MKKLSVYIFLFSIWCNVGHTFSLSDLSNSFKKNKPPAELFGIKLFENINQYSKYKISPEDLEQYFDDEINDPYLKKIRYFDGKDLEVIRDNYFYLYDRYVSEDSYNIYVNEKLEIQGIDGSNSEDLFKEDEKFQKCLNVKAELIDKIVELYNLNINTFKVQNYIFSNNDMPEYKDNIISQSVFKFNNDGIDLSYALACEIFVGTKESILWVELFTEKLGVAIYSGSYSKSEKSIEQLLN